MDTDIKVVYQTGGVDLRSDADNSNYPFQLYANLRPPEFMDFTFIALYGGSEEIIVRGKTKKALENFAKQHNLSDHPRLRRMEIT